MGSQTTLAVVIGVSKYESPVFPVLPGAVADARRFARALLSWGVNQENCVLLLDEQVTRRSLLEALRVRPLLMQKSDLRLIVFFAGHGTSVRDPGRLPVGTLLVSDSSPADRAGTGVTLPEIMKTLLRVRPKEAYLFFDACNLVVDELSNPFIKPEAEVKEGGGTLLVVLGAGELSAEEDAATDRGVFTRCLLETLSQLRRERGGAALLAQRLQELLRLEGAPDPEIILLGNAEGHPLPETAEEAAGVGPGASIHRSRVLSELQDIIVRNPGAPVWFWGMSGRGKTEIAKQLVSDRELAVYCSCPRTEDPGPTEILEEIAAQVAEAVIEIFPDGRPLPGTAQRTMAHLAERLPGLMLLVDHTERVPAQVLIEVVEALRLPRLDVVFVSQRASPSSLLQSQDVRFIEYECPVLTVDEVVDFMEVLYPAIEAMKPADLLALSGGSPLRLRQILEPLTAPFSGMPKPELAASTLRALAHVVACDGYFSEVDFSKAFDVPFEALQSLTNLGLVRFNSQGSPRFLPHDAGRELAKGAMSFIDFQLVGSFLAREVNRYPRNDGAALRLVNFCIETGWIREIDASLVTAINTVVRRRNWILLERLGDVLIGAVPHSHAAMKVAEELVHVARSRIPAVLAASVLRGDPSSSTFMHAQLIEAERHWWIGDDAAIQRLSRPALDNRVNPAWIGWALLGIGIGAFWQGRWEEAIDNFELAIANPGTSNRHHAWCCAILGTIQALLGWDVETGVQNLEKALSILEFEGDDNGAAMAWNNLGEVNWKLERLSEALVQVSTAHQLAASIGNKAIEFEAYRNLLHIELRLYGPFSSEIENRLKEARTIIQQEIEPVVSLQLWNTLATVFAYRGQVAELKVALTEARHCTETNSEYAIYTWSNTALLAVLERDADTARSAASEALNLARQGRNLLAVKQLYDDMRFVSELLPLNGVSSLLEVVKAAGAPELIGKTLKGTGYETVGDPGSE